MSAMFLPSWCKVRDGMHFIGSAAHGQTLDKLMRYLEIDKTVTLSQLDPQGYECCVFGWEKVMLLPMAGRLFSSR